MTILLMSNTGRYIPFGILCLVLIVYVLIAWLPKWKNLNNYNKILRVVLFTSIITYFFYVFKIIQEWTNSAKLHIGVGKMMHKQLEEVFIKELETNNIFIGSIILLVITWVLSYFVKDVGRNNFPKEILKTK